MSFEGSIGSIDLIDRLVELGQPGGGDLLGEAEIVLGEAATRLRHYQGHCADDACSRAKRRHQHRAHLKGSDGFEMLGASRGCSEHLVGQFRIQLPETGAPNRAQPFGRRGRVRLELAQAMCCSLLVPARVARAELPAPLPLVGPVPRLLVLLAVVVVVALVNIYSEGIRNKTEALANSLSERLSSPLQLGLNLSDFSQVDAVFQDYKTLEGKAVDVDDFQAAASALPVIEASLARYSAARQRGFRGGKKDAANQPPEKE